MLEKKTTNTANCRLTFFVCCFCLGMADFTMQRKEFMTTESSHLYRGLLDNKAVIVKEARPKRE
jgi:hypothetical protein